VLKKIGRTPGPAEALGFAPRLPTDGESGTAGQRRKKVADTLTSKFGAGHGQSRRIYVAKRLLPKSRELSISDSQKRLGNLKLPVPRGLLRSPLFHFHSGFEH
jgi:hypothetical protein